MSRNQPIAVFDTGAGGLSVVKALRAQMPHEKISYYADYAHLPYGLKSPELIKHLAHQATEKLCQLSKPKLLIIACHTVSVWCLNDIQKSLNVPVLGMLSPAIAGLERYLSQNNVQTFGIISTKATLHSGAYKNAWVLIDPAQKTGLIEQACGPLVSLIEEDSLDMHQLLTIVQNLLCDDIKNADALMLGCTHFSALVPILKKVLKKECTIIDAAEFVAQEVFKDLQAQNLLSSGTITPSIEVFVSDNPERFLSVAPRFIDDAFNISSSTL